MVGSPCVQSTSLTATGSPASSPSGLPALRRRSISSARVKAAAGSTRRNAFTWPSCRSMRSSIRLGELHRSDFPIGKQADQFGGGLSGHRGLPLSVICLAEMLKKRLSNLSHHGVPLLGTSSAGQQVATSTASAKQWHTVYPSSNTAGTK